MLYSLKSAEKKLGVSGVENLKCVTTCIEITRQLRSNYFDTFLCNLSHTGLIQGVLYKREIYPQCMWLLGISTPEF